MITDIDKLFNSIELLKPKTELTFSGEIVDENTYKTIDWKTGEINGEGITTKTNPHAELSWVAVKAEMDKL
jgi:hypothetical protein